MHRSKLDKVLFVIVGDFPDLNFKKKLINTHGVKFFLIGNQPFSSIPKVVAIGDVCVLWQDKGRLVSQFQVPAKLSDVLAMGLTVLAEATPALADFIIEGAVTVIDRDRFPDQLLKALETCSSTHDAEKTHQVFVETLSFAVNGHLLESYARDDGQFDGRDSQMSATRLANLFAGQLPILPSLSEIFKCKKNKEILHITTPPNNIKFRDSNFKNQVKLKRNLRSKTKNRLVVYTAIIGQYDKIINPELIVHGWDYVIFTNMEVTTDTIYEVRKPSKKDVDPVRMARYIKANPHILLPEYEYSLWIDGNVLLKSGSFEKQLNYYMDNNVDAVFRRHPIRSCMYEEIEKCIELLKDDFGLMLRQIARYQKEKVPSGLGLFETNVILRKNNKIISSFNSLWWKEISKGSRRDQLSVMYSIYKNDINYKLFPEKHYIRSLENEWYIIV